MLHELIFALNGFPGHLFIFNKESNEIMLDKNIPFIHQSEADLLNQVLKLSSYFIQLQQFLDEQSNELYLNALKDGISIILHDYRKILIDLESELLKDSHLTLSYIQSQLANYFTIFQTLNQLVKDIHTNEINGCCLLTLLQRQSFNGDPLLSEIILRLLNKCFQVFYYQLASWLFKGNLPKQDNEFFIFCKNDATNNIQMATEVNNLQMDSPYKVIFLSIEMLPIFISPKVGQQILFVGESVRNFTLNKNQTHIDEQVILEQSEIQMFTNDLKIISQNKYFPIEKFEEFIELIRSHISKKKKVPTATLR